MPGIDRHPSLRIRFLLISPNAPKNSKKLMQVIINSKPHTTEATHLAQLIEELGLPAIGTAAAVNNKMVPRTQWPETALTPDLPITIIRAACGG